MQLEEKSLPCLCSHFQTGNSNRSYISQVASLGNKLRVGIYHGGDVLRSDLWKGGTEQEQAEKKFTWFRPKNRFRKLHWELWSLNGLSAVSRVWLKWPGLFIQASITHWLWAVLGRAWSWVRHLSAAEPVPVGADSWQLSPLHPFKPG